VVPHKVSIGDQIDWKEILQKMNFLFPSLQCKMGSPQVLMVFLVSFTRRCGTQWGKIFAILHMRYFPQGSLLETLNQGLDQAYSKEYN
jgi:hypothetical protein